MRDRQSLGGVRVAVARQREAEQAALAGGNASGVADVKIRQRAELSAALIALTERIYALRSDSVASLRRTLIAAAAGAAAALAAQAKLRGNERCGR